MPFEKGHIKVGGRSPGRPKGSVSKRTQVARDLIEKLNYCPLENLLKIARARRYSIEIRMDAMKAALPFLYPKLSTVFMNAKTDSTVDVRHYVEAAMADPALAAAMQTISLGLSARELEAHRATHVDPDKTLDRFIDVKALPEPEPEQNAEMPED